MGTNGANFAWVPSVSMLASEHVAGDESSTSKAAVRGASSDWGGDPASSSPLMGGLAVDLPDVFAGEVLLFGDAVAALYRRRARHACRFLFESPGYGIQGL